MSVTLAKEPVKQPRRTGALLDGAARHAARLPPPPSGAGPVTDFFSIAYRSPRDAAPETRAVPEYFHDLVLDQIVDPIVAQWQDYDLAPLFYTRLDEVDAIVWRHEVFRDLEREAMLAAVHAFSDRMRTVRLRLAQAEKARYRYEKERLHLEAARCYAEAIGGLLPSLESGEIDSRGMLAFRAYLGAYARSPVFEALKAELAAVAAGLDAVRYCILIDGATVTVRPYAGEADYTAAVEATFEKFRRTAVGDYRVRFPGFSGVNHIEAQIQDRVALLDPEPFRALDAFSAAHRDFIDASIARFDREIQFYVAWLAYLAPLGRRGLPWCYPHVARVGHEVSARGAYDLALAEKLVAAGASVVCNDFALSGDERVFVVSGPNNGGKTTFARMFGQLHHLAQIGCPVPGSEVALRHFDRMFVHFERREDVANLRGKLLDDLIRIRGILGRMTPESIVIMNEIFSSTTLVDAVFLGRKVLERISALDAIGVCVTFLDELATVNSKMVSLTSTVDPHDPAIRTFRIVRRPPGGRIHALAIAEKYHVDYASLKERFQP